MLKRETSAWTRLARSLVGGATLLLLGATASSATTLRTITIDGNLQDWTEVLLDPQQTVADKSTAQGDPDAPGQSQRDERGVAVTWDASNIYFYFSRTGGGTNSFNAVFYFDLNHDGTLSSTDRVVFFGFSGASYQTTDVYFYNDGGSPDSLGGDGVTPAGAKGAFITSAGGNGAGESTGIRFETSLSWGSLGFGGPASMYIHPAISSNTNIPGGVLDNAPNLDTRLAGVRLTGGASKGTAPGRSVNFAHRVTNDGTATDTINLVTRSLLGFGMEVWTDPNGDGNPADGTLLAKDANGDGDWTDLGDTRPTGSADADSNGQPDGGTLAAGASRNFVVRITVPNSATSGQEDTISVYAASSYKPSVRRQVQDFVKVGLVTVSPTRNAIGAPGFTANLGHTACNNSGVARVLDVTVTSGLGWTTSGFSDPNGDGDPSDGSALTDHDSDGTPDLGTVADGVCVSYVARDSVPGGTPAGTVDNVTVRAADGATSDQVVDVLTIATSRVDVAPDRTANSQPGKTIYLRHVLTNAGSLADTFALLITSTLGSTVDVLSDPNGNGEPDDSAVIVNTSSVAGNGGTTNLISRIRIPSSAVHGNTDTDTLRGTSDSNGAQDTAVDTVNVKGLLTYSDPLFARPSSTFFGQCATVYALAFKTGGGVYRFQWLDPTNAVIRTSPDYTPYSDGQVDDFYGPGAAPTPGTWTVKLQQKTGSSYTDVGVSGTTTFQVIDLVSAGAAIINLDTISDIYAQNGENVSGFSEEDNPTSADILGSAVEYVIWRDSNGDNAPSSGEDYIQSNGTTASWATGNTSEINTNIDVRAGERYGDTFFVGNVQFSQVGTWKVEAKWKGSCGFLISTRVVAFTVGCQPPPTFAGLASASDVAPCTVSGIALSWATASNWGLGFTGVYDVYRSTDPAFTPGPTNLIATGVNGLSYTDTTAVQDQVYYYNVQAESNVTCSNGPNNNGLLDGNLVRRSSADLDWGVPPTASFTHTGSTCRVAGTSTIQFTDTSAGPTRTRTWDFNGDGITDSTTSPATYVYVATGTYTVTLNVENPCGTDVHVEQVTITEAPLAVVVSDRNSTCLGEPVDFDGSGSSATAPATLTAWDWDFDGDTISDSIVPNPPPVSFATTGTKNVLLTVTDSNGCVDTEVHPVDVYAALTASTQAPVVNHCTGQSSVQASVSGGHPPYAYSWDVLSDNGSGLGSATFALGSSTTAHLTVTDASGCTALATSAPIVVNPQIAVSLGAPVIDQCTGHVSIQATTTGGSGSYTWVFTTLTGTGGGAADAMLAPGPYTVNVTATDSNGCVANASSAPFTVLPRLDVTMGAPLIDQCTGLVHVQASASGGDGVYSYAFALLAPQGGGVAESVQAPGTYTETVTVTDGNGCQAQFTSAPFTVLPAVGVSMAAPVIDQCTGTVSVQATGTGGTGTFSYAFTTLTATGGGAAQRILAPGTYTETVTVTDGNGCQAVTTSAPFTVLPRLSVTAPLPIVDQCTGTVTMQATASGGDGNYSYSFARLADLGGGAASGIVPPGTWTETVTVTDGNGCRAVFTTAAFTVLPALALNSAAPLIDQCTGQVSLQATASGGDGSYSYAFTLLTGTSGGQASGTLAPGTYTETITVTDGNGCRATHVTAPFTVLPQLGVSVSPFVIDQCTGQVSLQATATGGNGSYSYVFSQLTGTGGGAASGVLAPGTYRETVTVTDGNGCRTSLLTAPFTVLPKIGVILPAPAVNACNGLVTAGATASGGDGNYSYAFTLLSGTGGGGASATLAPGTYTETVTVTDGNGCQATATSAPFTVPDHVVASFVPDVVYVYPDVFQATLTAGSSGGTAPFDLAWDYGANGTTDAIGPTYAFAMGANETVPVLLTVTDGNGCIATFLMDVVSAGCPVDTELTGLRVRKSPTGYVMTWDPSVHPCHGRYDLLEAATARPAVLPGSWPTDPAFTSLRPIDGDTSDLNESFSLDDVRAGAKTLFYLVRDGGTDGTWGPVGSYGGTGITP